MEHRQAQPRFDARPRQRAEAQPRLEARPAQRAETHRPQPRMEKRGNSGGGWREHAGRG
jgi:hypothetical protein